MNRESRRRTQKKKGIKITPKPKFKKQGVDFADLEPGDYFIHSNELCIKLRSTNQEAVNTLNGQIYYKLCGFYVLPADVEIKWMHKV